jgi:hypothetical protein
VEELDLPKDDMEKLRVHVSPTPEDYSSSLRPFMARNNLLWIFLGFLGIPFPIFFLVFFVRNGIRVFSDWSLGSIYTLFVTGLMAYLFYTPKRLESSAKKDKKFTLPAEYIFDEEGVEIMTSAGSNKLIWKAFEKVFETSKYYFLIYAANKNVFQFIPKIAFATSEQENVFRQMVTQGLSGILAIDKGLRGWRLSFTIGGVVTLLVFTVAAISLFQS